VFEKAFLIEDVTDSIKVEHHKYWAPPFVSKRDMCVRLNKARLDDGTVVLTGKSVVHKDCPEDVRHTTHRPTSQRRGARGTGWLALGGWMIRTRLLCAMKAVSRRRLT